MEPTRSIRRLMRTAAACAALLAIGLPAHPAFAQQSDDQAEPQREQKAVDVLRAAQQAVKELDALAFDVNLTGEGTGPLSGLSPTGSGEIRMVRAEAPGLGGRWHRRITGRVTEPRAGATPIDFLRTPDIDEWKAADSKTVIRRPTARQPPGTQANYRMLVIGELLGETPFAAELDGVSVTHDGVEDVNGVPCEVIRVEYDPSDRSRARTTIPSVVARWFIAQDDRLPRRIERINEGGGISLTIVQELSAVRVDPGMAFEDLRIEVPEGWTLDDRLGKPRVSQRQRSEQDNDRAQRSEETRERQEQSQQGDQQEEQDEPQADSRDYEAAPGFEMVDPDGESVDLAAIEGRVAVLYFWGTWSATARDYSPLISELAQKHEDRPVSVYGPVVNQRDRSAVLDAVEQNGYAFTPLFGTDGRGIGADNVARSMGVRFFPTVFVIDAQGRIRLTEAAGRDADPEAIVQKVDEAIAAALDDLDN